MSLPVQAVPLTGSDQVISVIGLVYKGFSIRETAGAVATIRVWDSPNSTTTDDTILDPIQLAANESAREFYEDGIAASKGVWIEVVAGTVEGSIRVLPTQARDLLDTRSV